MMRLRILILEELKQLDGNLDVLKLQKASNYGKMAKMKCTWTKAKHRKQTTWIKIWTLFYVSHNIFIATENIL